jgi:hypothetical protein
MNSKQTISLSELSKGGWAEELSRAEWADEFLKGEWAKERPAEPPPHSAEQNLVARLRSKLSKLAPLMSVRSRVAELLPRAQPTLTALAQSTLARYLIVFFIGVTAAVVWQSYRGGTKEETAAATSAALDSVRQSVDNLAAEITKIRAVEQDILARISAPPPQPAAASPRNPAQRPSLTR